MEKTRKEYVAEYCDKIRSGKLDYTKLRNVLEFKIKNEEDISIIMERVDRDLKRAEIADLERTKGKQMFYGGLAIMIGGITLTVTTYLGVIDLGGRFFIAYGPTLGGLGMALVGLVKINK